MINHKTKHPFLALFTIAVFLLPAFASQQAQAGELAVKDGEAIAFMGDSITQAGHNKKNGYVNLVMEALNQEGLNIKKIPAGKSGNKSSNMLNRLDQSVISKNPDCEQAGQHHDGKRRPPGIWHERE